MPSPWLTRSLRTAQITWPSTGLKTVKDRLSIFLGRRHFIVVTHLLHPVRYYIARIPAARGIVRGRLDAVIAVRSAENLFQGAILVESRDGWLTKSRIERLNSTTNAEGWDYRRRCTWASTVLDQIGGSIAHVREQQPLIHENCEQNRNVCQFDDQSVHPYEPLKRHRKL